MLFCSGSLSDRQPDSSATAASAAYILSCVMGCLRWMFITSLSLFAANAAVQPKDSRAPSDEGESNLNFGSPAVLGYSRRPVALRPQLSLGLPLTLPEYHRSRLTRQCKSMLSTHQIRELWNQSQPKRKQITGQKIK